MSEAKTTHYIVLLLLSLTLVGPCSLAIISWLAAAAVVPGLGKLTKGIASEEMFFVGGQQVDE